MRHKSIFLLILLLLTSLLISACGGDDEDEPETLPAAANLDPDSPEGRGASLFQTYCATCHAVVGERKIVGPPLTHIATVAATRVEGQDAESYLRTSIIAPNEYIVEGFAEGSMQQNFSTQLTSDQLNDVLAFLFTLE